MFETERTISMISQRAQNIVASVTGELSAKVTELKAQGKDVIKLNIGEPDFRPPENIAEAAVAAIEEGFSKYVAIPGIIELRKAICAKLEKDNHLVYSPKEICVSTGAKQAVMNALMALCDPGDEVIIPTPCWVSYSEMVKLTGAAPVFVPCKAETGFALNVDDIAAAVTPHTKAIIICTPNNPTGAVYSEQTLRALAALAVEKDFYIIADEIYEKLIFGDAKHFSIASISEEVRERCVTINGFSKAYAIPGWRLGYSAAIGEVAASIKSIQSHATSAANCIAQRAGVAALTGPQDSVEAMRREYERRRDYAFDALKAMPGVELEMPHGAFYVMMNISEYIGKKLHGKLIESANDFADAFLDNQLVAVVPGNGFDAPNYVRWSYATSLDNIKEGISRLEKFLK